MAQAVPRIKEVLKEETTSFTSQVRWSELRRLLHQTDSNKARCTASGVPRVWPWRIHSILDPTGTHPTKNGSEAQWLVIYPWPALERTCERWQTGQISWIQTISYMMHGQPMSGALEGFSVLRRLRHHWMAAHHGFVRRGNI